MTKMPRMTTSVTRKSAAPLIMKPRPLAGGDELGGDERRPARAKTDAGACQDAREGVRQKHAQNDLPARGAEGARGVDHVARHGLEAVVGRDHDRGQNAEEDNKDLCEFADAEPDDDERQIGQRRDRPVEFEQRFDDAAPGLAEVHGEAENDAEDDRADKRRADTPDARQKMLRQRRVLKAVRSRRETNFDATAKGDGRNIAGTTSTRAKIHQRSTEAIQVAIDTLAGVGEAAAEETSQARSRRGDAEALPLRAGQSGRFAHSTASASSRLEKTSPFTRSRVAMKSDRPLMSPARAPSAY